MSAVLQLVTPPTLPQSVEIEQALLGAVLTDNAAFEAVATLVVADDFFDPMHAQLWRVIEVARREGRAVTATLLKAELGAEGEHEIMPGRTLAWYISQLFSEVLSVRDAPSYARTLRQHADARRIIVTCEAAVAQARRGLSAKPSEIATLAIAELDAVATSGASTTARSMSIDEAVDAAADRCEAIADGTAQAMQISWGLESLNRHTNGVERGDLIILGGRPSMGKTTVGEALALLMAGQGHGVGFYSLEMSAQQLGQRAIAWAAFDGPHQPLTYLDIRAGRIDQDQRRSLSAARRRFRGLPIHIEQEGGLTLAQIAGRARRLKADWERRSRRLDVLIVDHLGIIAPSQRYAGHRVHEVSEFSAGLKRLAKELDVAVIALSQLSRGTEHREDKRPTLADLRDSGSLEQDADMVIGLYREAYYLEKIAHPTDEQLIRLAAAQNVLEFIVLKQRQGPTGTVQLFASMPCNFVGELQR